MGKAQVLRDGEELVESNNKILEEEVSVYDYFLFFINLIIEQNISLSFITLESIMRPLVLKVILNLVFELCLDITLVVLLEQI